MSAGLIVLDIWTFGKGGSLVAKHGLREMRVVRGESLGNAFIGATMGPKHAAMGAMTALPGVGSVYLIAKFFGCRR